MGKGEGNLSLREEVEPVDITFQVTVYEFIREPRDKMIAL